MRADDLFSDSDVWCLIVWRNSCSVVVLLAGLRISSSCARARKMVTGVDEVETAFVLMLKGGGGMDVSLAAG